MSVSSPRTPQARADLLSPDAGGGRSVAVRTFDHLLDQIMTFQLKPYEQVSEKLLSDALGVSRTPVREAMALLAKLRFIDIYPQRGSFVAPLRLADLQKSQFLREALEVALAVLALESPDRAHLVRKLRDELAVQETFVAISDDRRFYKSDEAFHQLIASFAGLPGIWEDINSAKLHMDRFRFLSFPRIDSMATVLGQHRDIVEALDSGSREGLERSMKAHLRRVFEVVDVVREKFPEYFDSAEMAPETGG